MTLEPSYRCGSEIFVVYIDCLKFYNSVVVIMADSDPIFFKNIKSTGKKIHKFLFGSYILYRRDVKPSGYATRESCVLNVTMIFQRHI